MVLWLHFLVELLLLGGIPPLQFGEARKSEAKIVAMVVPAMKIDFWLIPAWQIFKNTVYVICISRSSLDFWSLSLDFATRIHSARECYRRLGSMSLEMKGGKSANIYPIFLDSGTCRGLGDFRFPPFSSHDIPISQFLRGLHIPIFGSFSAWWVGNSGRLIILLQWDTLNS